MSGLRILPEVLEDVNSAANWYDEKGYLGLGDRFIETFYSCIPHLLESGTIYSTSYLAFHKILLKPFPYFVFYRYHENLLVVALVIGASRKPARIQRLLRSRQ